jgi:hypothetical protein
MPDGDRVTRPLLSELWKAAKVFQEYVVQEAGNALIELLTVREMLEPGPLHAPCLEQRRETVVEHSFNSSDSLASAD